MISAVTWCTSCPPSILILVLIGELSPPGRKKALPSQGLPEAIQRQQKRSQCTTFGATFGLYLLCIQSVCTGRIQSVCAQTVPTQSIPNLFKALLMLISVFPFARRNACRRDVERRSVRPRSLSANSVANSFRHPRH